VFNNKNIIYVGTHCDSGLFSFYIEFGHKCEIIVQKLIFNHSVFNFIVTGYIFFIYGII